MCMKWLLLWGVVLFIFKWLGVNWLFNAILYTPIVLFSMFILLIIIFSIFYYFKKDKDK